MGEDGLGTRHGRYAAKLGYPGIMAGTWRYLGGIMGRIGQQCAERRTCGGEDNE